MITFAQLLLKAREKPYRGKGKRTGTPGHYEYQYEQLDLFDASPAQDDAAALLAEIKGHREAGGGDTGDEWLSRARAAIEKHGVAKVRAELASHQRKREKEQRRLDRPKLSPAQEKALDAIEAGAGRGYGERAHLRSSTVRALERKGLVVLGWQETTGGRRIPWAIGAGSAPPYGFVSNEERRVEGEAARKQIRERVAEETRAMPKPYRVRTTGEYARLPVGSVVEMEVGGVYVKTPQGGWVHQHPDTGLQSSGGGPGGETKVLGKKEGLLSLVSHAQVLPDVVHIPVPGKTSEDAHRVGAFLLSEEGREALASRGVHASGMSLGPGNSMIFVHRTVPDGAGRRSPT